MTAAGQGEGDGSVWREVMGRGVGPGFALPVQLAMAARGMAGSAASSPRLLSHKLRPPLTPPLTPPLSALASEDAPLIVPRQTCASDSPPCPHLAPRPTPTPPRWSPPPVLLLQEASLDQPVAGVPGSDPPVPRRPWGGGFCPGVHAASPSSNPQPGLSGCQLLGKGGTGEAFSLCRRLVSMATAQLGSTS